MDRLQNNLKRWETKISFSNKLQTCHLFLSFLSFVFQFNSHPKKICKLTLIFAKKIQLCKKKIKNQIKNFKKFYYYNI